MSIKKVLFARIVLFGLLINFVPNVLTAQPITTNTDFQEAKTAISRLIKLAEAQIVTMASLLDNELVDLAEFNVEELNGVITLLDTMFDDLDAYPHELPERDEVEKYMALISELIRQLKKARFKYNEAMSLQVYHKSQFITPAAVGATVASISVLYDYFNSEEGIRWLRAAKLGLVSAAITGIVTHQKEITKGAQAVKKSVVG